MEIVHIDDSIIVCVKPPRVLSTDEEGGLPGLVREYLCDEKAGVFTVHRLDRVVSGLMVLARSSECARALSAQITGRSFEKEYLAVCHGAPEDERGTMTDLLCRSKQERKTYVTDTMAKGVQEAVLDYETLGRGENMALLRITLRTGRTHQIRAQLSSRNMPLFGDRKYSTLGDECEIALWSYRLAFDHPVTGERMMFKKTPPKTVPWTAFGGLMEPI